MGAQKIRLHGKGMHKRSRSVAPSGPVKPSDGLAAIDALVKAGERFDQLKRRKDADDEVRRIQRAMHQLEATSGGESVADVLEGLVASTPPASLSPGDNLSPDQVRVLERVGSLVESMPSHSQRATTVTRADGAELFTRSLVTAEVADLLHVSKGRVRQRAAAGTLYAIKSRTSTRFPRFQFTDHGVLPGWEAVAVAIPTDVHPLAVENVVRAPSQELEREGKPISPYEWLETGGAPEQVVQVVKAAFMLNA